MIPDENHPTFARGRSAGIDEIGKIVDNRLDVKHRKFARSPSTGFVE